MQETACVTDGSLPTTRWITTCANSRHCKRFSDIMRLWRLRSNACTLVLIIPNTKSKNMGKHLSIFFTFTKKSWHWRKTTERYKGEGRWSWMCTFESSHSWPRYRTLKTLKFNTKLLLLCVVFVYTFVSGLFAQHCFPCKPSLPAWCPLSYPFSYHIASALEEDRQSNGWQTSHG